MNHLPSVIVMCSWQWHLSTSVPESEGFGGDSLGQLDGCDGDEHARDLDAHSSLLSRGDMCSWGDMLTQSREICRGVLLTQSGVAHVRKQVCCVGEDSERVGEHASDNLNDHEHKAERGCHQELVDVFRCVFWRLGGVVVVAAAAAVIMTVAMTVAVLCVPPSVSRSMTSLVFCVSPSVACAGLATVFVPVPAVVHRWHLHIAPIVCGYLSTLAEEAFCGSIARHRAQ